MHAAPAVKAEALPFLRIMFVFSSGMMVFFMLGGALRSAGDARTPMVLGIAMTVLNIAFNVVLIRGLGPIPAFGTRGAAMGTCASVGARGALLAVQARAAAAGSCRSRAACGYGPTGRSSARCSASGCPTGIQGIAMNIGGVFMLAFIGSLAQSAAAQAAFAVSYSQLFSFVTWTSVGLMGAAAAVAGQNLGAGKPDRAEAAVHVAARIGLAGAAFLGLFFFFLPRQLLAVFGMNEPAVVEIGTQLLRVLSVSGLFITVALTYTGGLQGTGDTKSPLYISIVSQIVVPLGICFVDLAYRNAAADPHLDRDPRRPRDALRAERGAVQSGQVAHASRWTSDPADREPSRGEPLHRLSRRRASSFASPYALSFLASVGREMQRILAAAL